MKTTKEQLYKIIKEEIASALNEEGELKEEEGPIVEKWKGKSEIKKLDKYGKEEMTKAELCTKRDNLKNKKKRTAKQSKELKRINFAIRSRQPGKKFGKVKC